MQNTTLLYYSPGSISLPVHFVLRELRFAFELIRTPTGDDAHLHADYLAVNPAGRVPTLIHEGKTLTEVWAILRYLTAVAADKTANLVDDSTRAAPAVLVPEDAFKRYRMDALLSRALTTAQPAYRALSRPDRVLGTDVDTAAQTALATAAKSEFVRTLHLMNATVDDDGWALGETLSLADPVLATLVAWTRYANLDPREFPNLARIARRYLARPVAQAALMAEGLVDENGNPTPPARI